MRGTQFVVSLAPRKRKIFLFVEYSNSLVHVYDASVSLKPPFFNFFFCYPSELLDALTKNGSSVGNGAYRRRPAETSENAGAQPEKESQESGVADSSKGFTKEQVEGVQR